MSSRFVSSGIEKLLSDRKCKNTEKSTQISWRIFNAYLSEKNISVDICSCTKSELDNVLKEFYTSARKSDGSRYKKTSFRSLRAGIQRKIIEIRPTVNIVNDTEFTASRNVFNAQCKELKEIGLANVEHKTAIPRCDVSKLYSSGTLSNDNPISLQYKFFFELTLYFCRRGRENLRLLKKNDFKVRTNENGFEEVVVDVDELTKNHGPNDAVHVGGVMHATNNNNCPVFTFKKYIEKLSCLNPFLFQRPKKRYLGGGEWYENMVVGVNTLSEYMKSISVKAELSQIFTNHSIRATSITALIGSGFEARNVIAFSGHRSEASIIRTYCRVEEN